MISATVDTNSRADSIAAMLRGDSPPDPQAFLDAVIKSTLAQFDSVSAELAPDRCLLIKVTLRHWDPTKLGRLTRWATLLPPASRVTVVDDPRAGQLVHVVVRTADAGGVLYLTTTFSRANGTDAPALRLIDDHAADGPTLVDELVKLATGN